MKCDNSRHFSELKHYIVVDLGRFNGFYHFLDFQGSYRSAIFMVLA